VFNNVTCIAILDITITGFVVEHFALKHGRYRMWWWLM